MGHLNNKILIIIPTYNEKDTIARLAKEIFLLNPHFHVLFVTHSTRKGNRLLAENIADVILRECFNK